MEEKNKNLKKVDFENLLYNYENGYISTWKFVLTYNEYLHLMGSNSLDPIIVHELQPLADFLAEILRDSEKHIEDFYEYREEYDI